MVKDDKGRDTADKDWDTDKDWDKDMDTNSYRDSNWIMLSVCHFTKTLLL